MRWGVIILCAVCMFTGIDAAAIEYSIQQVADETRANSDVTIGDTGIALWITSKTNESELGTSDVASYQDGKLILVTEDNPLVVFGSVKPVIDSETAVWVAGYSKREFISWQLVEVPTRDEGAVELPALYRAEEIGGVQELVAINQNTNEFSATDTNNPTAEPQATAIGATNEIRRHPSGYDEVVFWQKGKDPIRITSDGRHDFAPSVSGRLISWQIEKGFPFGWEIMAWDDGKFVQLTTNFYYDMAPKVHKRQIVWYGWDGHDFEIFLHDRDKEETTQITSNQFDDVSPVIWDGAIAWEGYPAAESDVYFWKPGQEIRKISDNIEDDFNPRIWNGQVIWQGFDGDDYEIYFFDGEKTIKLTSNLYDDANPDLRDGLAVWIGNFDNWDAEIYAWDMKGDPLRLTDNEYEDRDPKTAGGRIVWQQEHDGFFGIFYAAPK